MADKKIALLAVVGPTASGKTGLGVELAVRLGGEVVSCDSMQIYRGMDIATAKPTVSEMRGIKHHLIDFCEQTEHYSVARYVRDASAAINGIVAGGKLPILVGGTGLYYEALVGGVEFDEHPVDYELRSRLQQDYLTFGGEQMLCRLREVDTECADRLHPADSKRIIRALEVYLQTGQTISEQQRRSRLGGSRYRLITVGIDYPRREELYERINRRVDMMLDSGLLDEARQNCAGGTAVQAIGHKELADYLAGKEQLETATERLKRETRRYAKRQLSFFRRFDNINWLCGSSACVSDLAEQAIALIDSDFIRTAKECGINIRTGGTGV